MEAEHEGIRVGLSKTESSGTRTAGGRGQKETGGRVAKFEDIADCLALVQKRGIARGGDSNQPCHSPMAYLAKAIGQILGAINVERDKARQRETREQMETELAR